MTFSQADLARKATDTADLLMYAISEAQIVESICDAYRKVVQDVLVGVGASMRDLGDDDLRRLRFEVLSFCVFLMHAHLSGHVTHRPESAFTKPDAGETQCFWQRFLARLSERLQPAGSDAAREIILQAVRPSIRFGLGEPLSLDRRLSQYRDASRAGQGSELRLFGRHVGLALDPPHYPVLEIIGVQHWDMILEMTKIVLRADL